MDESPRNSSICTLRQTGIFHCVFRSLCFSFKGSNPNSNLSKPVSFWAHRNPYFSLFCHSPAPFTIVFPQVLRRTDSLGFSSPVALFLIQLSANWWESPPCHLSGGPCANQSSGMEQRKKQDTLKNSKHPSHFKEPNIYRSERVLWKNKN